MTGPSGPGSALRSAALPSPSGRGRSPQAQVGRRPTLWGLGHTVRGAPVQSRAPGFNTRGSNWCLRHHMDMTHSDMPQMGAYRGPWTGARATVHPPHLHLRCMGVSMSPYGVVPPGTTYQCMHSVHATVCDHGVVTYVLPPAARMAVVIFDHERRSGSLPVGRHPFSPDPSRRPA